MLLYAYPLLAVLAAAPAPAVEPEPFLLVESQNAADTTLDALRIALAERSLKVLREHEESSEGTKRHTLYFCDFDILPRAVALDPRAGDNMPCQITVTSTGERVTLSARNPAFARHEHADTGHDPCAEARTLLVELMEEAAR